MTLESQDIQFWATRKRAGRRKPWEVRWRVDTSTFGRSFLTSALAETFRAKLVTAARKGEVFSTSTGKPLAWERSRETVYSVARSFIQSRWADDSANTRKALNRGLTSAVLVTVRTPKRGAKRAPDAALMGRAVTQWGLRPPAWDAVPPDDIASALRWVDDTSRPVADLADPAVLRDVLAALSRLADGRAAARATFRVRRSTLHALLDHAVELGALKVNPLTGLKTRRKRTSDRVDPRRVPSLDQAQRIIDAVPGRWGHLSAFFAVLYYSGCRPAEARALRVGDCDLPASGWGRLMLAASRPEVGEEWTDDGDRHAERELKHRAPGEVRPVPIPPVLVAALRSHLDQYGTAPDGRVFWHETKTKTNRPPVPGDAYRRAWQRARHAALTPAELSAGVAERVYDLRHGCASVLLSNRVSPIETARRLGHSVAQLYTTYAHWLDGEEEAANAILDTVWTTPDQPKHAS